MNRFRTQLALLGVSVIVVVVASTFTPSHIASAAPFECRWTPLAQELLRDVQVEYDPTLPVAGRSFPWENRIVLRSPNLQSLTIENLNVAFWKYLERFEQKDMMAMLAVLWMWNARQRSPWVEYSFAWANARLGLSPGLQYLTVSQWQSNAANYRAMTVDLFGNFWINSSVWLPFQGLFLDCS